MRELHPVVREDDWADPLRLKADHGAAADRLAFVLMRPDTVYQGMVRLMFDELRDAGFRILDAQVVRPHPRILEELYRYTQGRVLASGRRAMWWCTLRFYELAPAVAVLAYHPDTDRPAARVFAEAKGPANPACAADTHVRTRFRAQNIVMCAVHSSDATNTMLREACLFFGAERVAHSLGQCAQHPCEVDLSEVDAALAFAGFPVGQPRPQDNFHQLIVAIHANLLRAVAKREKIDTDAELRRAEALQSELAAPGYIERTALLRQYGQELESTPTYRAIADSPEGRILRWTCRLDRPGEILADELVVRLEGLGCALDPYAKVLLETGLAFHDWMTQEYLEWAAIGDRARAQGDDRVHA